jgi:hypothetical protein
MPLGKYRAVVRHVVVERNRKAGEVAVTASACFGSDELLDRAV